MPKLNFDTHPTSDANNKKDLREHSRHSVAIGAVLAGLSVTGCDTENANNGVNREIEPIAVQSSSPRGEGLISMEKHGQNMRALEQKKREQKYANERKILERGRKFAELMNIIIAPNDAGFVTNSISGIPLEIKNQSIPWSMYTEKQKGTIIFAQENGALMGGEITQEEYEKRKTRSRDPDSHDNGKDGGNNTSTSQLPGVNTPY